MTKLPSKRPTLWPVMVGILLTTVPWVTGCPREPVPPGPDADAAVVVVVTDGGLAATCAGWCAHAAALGCSAAKPTPAGGTCEQVCENVQNSGIVTWNLRCRVEATSCARADVCETP